MQGAIVLETLDGFESKRDSGSRSDSETQKQPDPFLASWKSQGPDFVKTVQEHLPITLRELSPDYFQTHLPYHGSSFVYDAVMSFGMAACLAQQYRGPEASPPPIPSNNTQVLKSQHEIEEMQALRHVQFQGASGSINFLEGSSFMRLPETFTIGAYNIRYNDTIEQFEAVLVAQTQRQSSNGETKSWHQIAPLLYANGQDTISAVQLQVQDENHLSQWVRVLGLSLLSIAYAVALGSAGFVYLFRESTPVRAGQPFFLQMVCGGSILTSSAIFTLSFDEGSGWTTDALTTACVITPWLFFWGLVTTYAGLFSMMWRVDRVLQMRRQRVKIIQVLGPQAALSATITLLLLWWTLVDPWVWQRDFVSMDPPVTYGECSSDSFAKFFVPLVGVKLVALALALYIGWKTMDVQESLSHARSVFSATLAHAQAWFIGLPILLAIGGDSADATYLGRVLLIWIFGVSTTAIVVCPKLYQAWLQKRSPNLGSTKRVRISGLNFQPAMINSPSGLSGPTDAETGATPAVVAVDAPVKGAQAKEQAVDVPVNTTVAQEDIVDNVASA